MVRFFVFLLFLNFPIFFTQAFENLPDSVPTPKDNPITKEKVELGKQLFFEPRLSKSGTISCNSCHNVMAGGDDNRAQSVGIEGKTGNRSAPTVWNSAFLSVQFWDGRAASLEDQAKGPITNPVEMGMENHSLAVKRIASIPGYQTQFKKAFPKTKQPVTIDNIAKAIASYERTLVTRNSPFDRFLMGDQSALSLSAKKGAELVKSVGCASCHSGPNFAGPLLPEGQGIFHKFPLYPNTELEKKFNFSKDLGRFDVTKKEEDRNTWRVPTWRNVALTAPYFHNGSVPTLKEAVQVMAKTQLNKDLSSSEVKHIVAFLESLTGEFPAQEMPRLPPLMGESSIK
ncbi:MAG: cytochrome-c peroxidase [Bdellovibrionales bacterium]|nr:cytochrome-c peroxidase [Bdellovibrionales bacterium]